MRKRNTAGTAISRSMPTAVRPAISAASTAPMPPGVGAADETADPTRYTTPMVTRLRPPPNASMVSANAAT